MEAPSFVSKARTALHSAAAKAERVLTDIKSDLKSDRDSDKQSSNSKISEPELSKKNAEVKTNHERKHTRWRSPQKVTKQDWHDRLKNIRIGKKGVDNTEKSDNSTMSFHIFDENLYPKSPKSTSEAKGSDVFSFAEVSNAIDVNNIPPSSVIKQLAVAVETGKKFKSMKDLMVSSRDSSPVRERAGLSLSAVKSLVLREEKPTSEFGDNEKVLSLIHLLLDAEGDFLRRKFGSDAETLATKTSLPREIHAAPPESLVVKLSEVIGNFKTLRKMAIFWCGVVAELRKLWSEEQYVPGIPLDEIPDLNCCLLYQQLQVINCCISRKRRHVIATESLDSVIREAGSNIEEPFVSKGLVDEKSILYARISTGELVLRLGAGRPSDNLMMLETGEPIYVPVTQEGPLLTEDLIKETEEFVLRTGSVGAGCSQLLSDMQAFKAANPGSILEDFVRWHSPPDWTDTEPSDECKDTFDGGDSLSARGQLSSRMRKEGNLWCELWKTAKPLPAVKQAPLFDEDLAVEGILHFLDDIPPSDLFKQLFVSLLGLGFVIAEATLSTNSNLSKLFHECKDYTIATCQRGTWIDKIDDLCQVYETVEMMLLHPEEILKIMKQPEEAVANADEPKRRFRRLAQIFGGKDRPARKPASKDQNVSEENPIRQPFSNMFDGRSSLFSKKPPKPDSTITADKPPLEENDWTIV
ncbi:uncharacterized protein LOC117909054 isoform X3 [Vitis riparia]|uniref:uncharacterized protein LOC117909054 isoform X3 n=1 Tax=Vitis riparia TaxID=96939 RepID=UPI00155A9430|nr:uncharacterized protein LOC117909054 isoform X3 [Vitis riparia]